MTPAHIYRKLVLGGSDELIRALCERIRADSGPAPGPAGIDDPVMTWRDLAAAALTERVLTPPEARMLWAIQSEPQVGDRQLRRAGAATGKVAVLGGSDYPPTALAQPGHAPRQRPRRSGRRA